MCIQYSKINLSNIRDCKHKSMNRNIGFCLLTLLYDISWKYRAKDQIKDVAFLHNFCYLILKLKFVEYYGDISCHGY